MLSVFEYLHSTGLTLLFHFSADFCETLFAGLTGLDPEKQGR